jgi:hypothetical protein
MAKFKVGDKVRIKDQKDWPTPPGFIFADAEGTVVKWTDVDEVMQGFQEFVYVQIEKAEGAAKVYTASNPKFFREEDLEKI